MQDIINHFIYSLQKSLKKNHNLDPKHDRNDSMPDLSYQLSSQIKVVNDKINSALVECKPVPKKLAKWVKLATDFKCQADDGALKDISGKSSLKPEELRGKIFICLKHCPDDGALKDISGKSSLKPEELRGKIFNCLKHCPVEGVQKFFFSTSEVEYAKLLEHSTPEFQIEEAFESHVTKEVDQAKIPEISEVIQSEERHESGEITDEEKDTRLHRRAGKRPISERSDSASSSDQVTLDPEDVEDLESEKNVHSLTYESGTGLKQTNDNESDKDEEDAPESHGGCGEMPFDTEDEDSTNVHQREIGETSIQAALDPEDVKDLTSECDSRLKQTLENVSDQFKEEKDRGEISLDTEDEDLTNVLEIPASHSYPISVIGETPIYLELSSSSSQKILDFGLDPEMDKYLFSTKTELDAELPDNLVVGRSGSSSDEMPTADEWHQANVINLSGKNKLSLKEKTDCPNLGLLFLQRNNGLTSIPSSFFDGMPSLHFLDLSNTRISVSGLPDSLFSLNCLQVLMLRGCVCLDSFPAKVKNLKTLEVLDFSSTDLYSLPEEIGQLTQLKHLKLSFYGPDYGCIHAHLPEELVSPSIFSELKDLETLSIVVHPEDQRWIRIAEDIINYVRLLKNLSNLEFYFPTVEAFNSFVALSPSWEKQSFKFKFVVGPDVKRIISRVPNEVESKYDGFNRCLRFVNGSHDVPEMMKIVLKSVKAFCLDNHLRIQSLSEFEISNFDELKFCLVRECPDFQVMMIGERSVHAAFPNLEHLGLHYLWGLEQILEDPVPPESFKALTYLQVDTCQKLKYIASQSMLQCLSNLETFIIQDCESLKSIVDERKAMNADASLLPRLTKLVLLHLPKLATLGTGLYPSEEIITHNFCPKLKLGHQPERTRRSKWLGSIEVKQYEGKITGFVWKGSISISKRPLEEAQKQKRTISYHASGETRNLTGSSCGISI